MAVLLLAEIAGGALALDATAKAVTAAKSLGDVTVPLCRIVTRPTTAPIAFATPACSGKIMRVPNRSPTAG